MRIAPLALILVAIAETATAASMGGVPDTMGLQATDPTLHGGRYMATLPSVSPKTRALLQLREEGLKLQEGDGGALTPEHRAYLQAKLNSIQAGNY